MKQGFESSPLNEIRVQTNDFDQQQQYLLLTNGNEQDGVVVTFVGLVRNKNEGKQVLSLTLEHYPGMTEKSLNAIADEARKKWDVGQIRIIHRVGTLALGEQIVYVGVAATHRKAAFHAAEFVMDFLKTKAPFWKKELTTDGEYWVEAKASDQAGGLLSNYFFRQIASAQCS
jgi:molybdopterin synthase catalytic subunit